MIAKKEFMEAAEGYALIDREARETAERYLKVFGSDREHITSFECDCYDITYIDHATIDFSTEASYCSCCGPDYESYSIPISYVWDTEWYEREKEKKAEQKRKEDERKAAKKAEEEKKREEKRYQSFLEMKKEYETVDPT